MFNPIQEGRNVLWKQRYRLPITYGLQIATTDPTRGLALSTRSGVEQLYAWQVQTGALAPLTHRPEGTGNTGDSVPNALLSPDGNFIYYFHDMKGNELGHFVRIPFTGGTSEDITPDLPSYTGFSLNMSARGNRCGFTLLRDAEYRIACLDVQPDGSLDKLRVLYHSANQTRGPILSQNGEVAVIESKASDSADFSLIALEAGTGQHIASLNEEAGGLELYLASPQRGDMRFLALSSRTGSWRPLLWNPVTGERVDLLLETLEGDLVPMDWVAQDTGTSRILLRQDFQAMQHLFIYHVETHTIQSLEKLESGTFGTTEPKSVFFGPDGDIYAIWENSAQPRQLIALDSETGERKRIVLASGKPLEGHPWTSITFPSSDGQRIQGWLARPSDDEPFPCIIEVHGGPEFAVMDTFSPSSQSWLDHGFAYLAINYRGSTGFGRSFQEQIRGHLGYWEVEDIVAARNWVVQQGIAAPSQILLTGWSWGGYLTLQTLGTHPGVFAAGMAGIAISDLVMTYETSTLRANIRGLIGGTPQDKPEHYRESSPVTYIAHIDAPILIIQGRHDARCPAEQIEIYEEKMKA
ncbi:MAG TPA: prolyl oligopeptidase family serine peptidase, partial [Ktedonobacteraceae bacterium]|nr:prolyl oligopeptidase family serine peptidase [Ktedonobacteraceae bacterium]